MSDEFDIYADLESFDYAEKCEKQAGQIAELENKLSETISRLSNTVEEKKALEKVNESLKQNIASLLLTAKTELKRKAAQINALREENLGLKQRTFQSGKKTAFDGRQPQLQNGSVQRGPQPDYGREKKIDASFESRCAQSKLTRDKYESTKITIKKDSDRDYKKEQRNYDSGLKRTASSSAENASSSAKRHCNSSFPNRAHDQNSRSHASYNCDRDYNKSRTSSNPEQRSNPVHSITKKDEKSYRNIENDVRITDKLSKNSKEIKSRALTETKWNKPRKEDTNKSVNVENEAKIVTKVLEESKEVKSRETAQSSDLKGISRKFKDNVSEPMSNLSTISSLPTNVSNLSGPSLSFSHAISKEKQPSSPPIVFDIHKNLKAMIPNVVDDVKLSFEIFSMANPLSNENDQKQLIENASATNSSIEHIGSKLQSSSDTNTNSEGPTSSLTESLALECIPQNSKFQPDNKNISKKTDEKPASQEDASTQAVLLAKSTNEIVSRKLPSCSNINTNNGASSSKLIEFPTLCHISKQSELQPNNNTVSKEGNKDPGNQEIATAQEKFDVPKLKECSIKSDCKNEAATTLKDSNFKRSEKSNHALTEREANLGGMDSGKAKNAKILSVDSELTIESCQTMPFCNIAMEDVNKNAEEVSKITKILVPLLLDMTNTETKNTIGLGTLGKIKNKSDQGVMMNLEEPKPSTSSTVTNQSIDLARNESESLPKEVNYKSSVELVEEVCGDRDVVKKFDKKSPMHSTPDIIEPAKPESLENIIKNNKIAEINENTSTDKVSTVVTESIDKEVSNAEKIKESQLLSQDEKLTHVNISQAITIASVKNETENCALIPIKDGNAKEAQYSSATHKKRSFPFDATTHRSPSRELTTHGCTSTLDELSIPAEVSVANCDTPVELKVNEKNNKVCEQVFGDSGKNILESLITVRKEEKRKRKSDDPRKTCIADKYEEITSLLEKSLEKIHNHKDRHVETKKITQVDHTAEYSETLTLSTSKQNTKSFIPEVKLNGKESSVETKCDPQKNSKDSAKQITPTIAIKPKKTNTSNRLVDASVNLGDEKKKSKKLCENSNNYFHKNKEVLEKERQATCPEVISRVDKEYRRYQQLKKKSDLMLKRTSAIRESKSNSSNRCVITENVCIPSKGVELLDKIVERSVKRQKLNELQEVRESLTTSINNEVVIHNNSRDLKRAAAVEESDVTQPAVNTDKLHAKEVLIEMPINVPVDETTETTVKLVTVTTDSEHKMRDSLKSSPSSCTPYKVNMSFGSTDYVVEEVSSNECNVFITRRRKRSKNLTFFPK